VPLPSRNKAFFAVLAASLLAACVRSAPDLPTAQAASVQVDAGENERLAKCAALRERLAKHQTKARDLNAVVEGNRTKNQTLGYLSATVLFPLALGTEGNQQEKDALDALQKERDAVYAEMKTYRCPQSLKSAEY